MTNTSPSLLRGTALLICLASAAAAQEPNVTVTGTGEVAAKPDCLEIEVRAVASAELTGDAVVKYQDALRRIRAALTKLNMKELKIDERELHFGSGDDELAQGAVFVGQPQPAAAKSTIHIAKSLRLSVRGIDKLSEVDLVGMISKLVDTAKDAGARIGKMTSTTVYSPMMVEEGTAMAVVHFVVEHAEGLREEAYRRAYADARTRAQCLAKLADAQLGKTISIQEDTDAMVAYQAQTAGADESRLSSDKLTEIPVRVTLRVQFALDDAKPESAKPEKGSVHAAP